MKPAAIVCLTTLLGFATAAWPQAAKPAQPGATGTAATLPAGVAAKIISVEGSVELTGAGIAVGQKASAERELKVGDGLVAKSGAALVQLTCANGVAFQLSDMFDVVISGAGPDERCTIDLKVGTAFGVSNPEKEGDAGKAAIKGGPLAAESGHTQFGITVPSGNPAASEAFVVEGEATVWSPGRKDVVTGGKMFYAQTRTIAEVPETKYRVLATNLARVDLQRAGAGGNAAAVKSLEATYYRTLRNPADKAARQDLDKQYKALKIPESTITRYNLRTRATANIEGAGAATVPQAPGNLSAESAVAPAPVAPMAGQIYVAPMGAQFASPAGIAGAPKYATFTNPMLGDRRLDYCLRWAEECGAPAADAYCRQQGFTRSSSFRMAENIGAQTPTRVLGDNRTCGDASCDGFTSINCE